LTRFDGNLQHVVLDWKHFKYTIKFFKRQYFKYWRKYLC